MITLRPTLAVFTLCCAALCCSAQEPAPLGRKLAELQAEPALRIQEIRAVVDAMTERDPRDPRAIEALVQIMNYRPPGERDSAERREWNESLLRILRRTGLDQNPQGIDPQIAESALVRWISMQEKDAPEMWRLIERLAERHPSAASPARAAKSYFQAHVQPQGPEAARQWLQSLTGRGAFSNFVIPQLALEDLRLEPMEWKFTALDGREVDVADLRGKVVLIDFWATWCPPCIAELPEVRSFYQENRSRGLEIIGVSLDIEDDRRKTHDFIARERMTWPQYGEFRRFDNPLVQRFGVDAIPLILVLGRDGRLVTTSAGKNFASIEPQVHRLLRD